MNWTLEVIVLPVTDVDRAKAFYIDQVGFQLDHDASPDPAIRVVQLTPRGSGCSICIGPEIEGAVPGSVKGLQLVVPDLDAARAELLERGVEVSPIKRYGEMDGGAFVYFQRPRRESVGGAGDPDSRMTSVGAHLGAPEEGGSASGVRRTNHPRPLI